MTRRRGGIGEDDIEERSRYLPADYSTIECGRRLGCLEGGLGTSGQGKSRQAGRHGHVWCREGGLAPGELDCDAAWVIGTWVGRVRCGRVSE
jgi:hypothetical protein